MANAPEKILKDHQLRATDSRLTILSAFCDKDYALSQPDLEKVIHDTFDRVTIYRTLNTFVDKGILHKVLDDKGASKFALCSDACSDHEHDHEHVHFKCNVCGQTTCLDHLGIPDFKLPEGFKLDHANLLLQGICIDCNNSS